MFLRDSQLLLVQPSSDTALLVMSLSTQMYLGRSVPGSEG